MDRLRNLTTRKRVNFHFRIPKSLSTTSLTPHKATDSNDGDDTKSTISSTSASAVLEPNLTPEPSSATFLPPSDTNTIQVQPNTQRDVFPISTQTSDSNKRNKNPERMGKARGETTAKTEPKGDGHSVASRKADQRLFNAAQAVIAQDNVIANSGLEVSRRMNECARDTMEANQTIKRKEHEIAAIGTKIEELKATFDDAYRHLQKAQDIAADALTSSISEQFRHKEEANLVDILMGMTNKIAKECSFGWPSERVNKCLEDLELVYLKNMHHCQSPVVNSGIVHVAKHFVFHANYEDKFQPMLFHLANQGNHYKGFVERSRREDRDFAKQHHVDYSLRPSTATKPMTNATSSNGDASTNKVKGKENGAAYEVRGLDGATEAAWSKMVQSKQEFYSNFTVLPPRSSSLPSPLFIEPACTSDKPNSQHTLGNAKLPGSCDDPACPCKHFVIRTDAGSNEWEDELVSRLEPRPGMTPNVMATAVLESIAGVEALSRDGMMGDSPEVKWEVASAIKLMGRLNLEHVKSEEVAQKLSTVAKKYGSCSLRPSEAFYGRARVEVTTGGCEPDCTPETAKRSGPESKDTRKDASPRGEMAAKDDDTDLMWKAFVSSAAAAKN